MNRYLRPLWRSATRRWTTTLIAAVVPLATAPTCAVDFTTGLPRIDLEDPPNAPAAEPQLDEVVIEFRNLTEQVVNVQFYTTSRPVELLPDDLFDDPANAMTTGIGLGGSGDLGPFLDDAIMLPCPDGVVVGTLGGEFRDNETGEVGGTGDTRWAQQGAQFSCNATIIFEYDEVGGTFVTTLKLD
ncbi:MAG: hypothetical protein ACE5E6_03785 [Phycisphaerae bacterium]